VHAGPQCGRRRLTIDAPAADSDAKIVAGYAHRAQPYVARGRKADLRAPSADVPAFQQRLPATRRLNRSRYGRASLI
jgi:hypothetical protein